MKMPYLGIFLARSIYDSESSKMGTKRYFDRAKKMVNSGNLEHELEVLRERVE